VKITREQQAEDFRIGKLCRDFPLEK